MSLEQAGIREGIPGHGRDRGWISWKVSSHPNHSGILGFTRDPMAELTSGALEPLESLPVLLPMDLDHHGRRGLDSGKILTWKGLVVHGQGWSPHSQRDCKSLWMQPLGTWISAGNGWIP